MTLGITTVDVMQLVVLGCIAASLIWVGKDL